MRSSQRSEPSPGIAGGRLPLGFEPRLPLTPALKPADQRHYLSVALHLDAVEEAHADQADRAGALLEHHAFDVERRRASGSVTGRIGYTWPAGPSLSGNGSRRTR